MRADVRARLPIHEIVEELGAGGKPRDIVLGAACVLAADLAPALLAAVEYAATGAELSERESALAFYGLHVLGAARDTRAFPALMRILRLPSEKLDPLLGDGLTMTINRVAIGTFNGAAGELYTLIADKEADEYARLEMLLVLAFLAFEGRAGIDEVKRFLIRFDDERLAPDGDMAWAGWENAIALLGFRDLVPRVQAVWRERRMPEEYSEPKYFFADLKRAETEWSNAERFKTMDRLGYIEDIVDELSWIAEPAPRGAEGVEDNEGFDRKDLHAAAGELDEWDGAPYINPMRHVGRNDPCPCGSGKKAKRCCLS